MAAERVLQPMEMAQLSRVMEIERACFADPWPPSAFLAEMSHRWSWFQLAGELRDAGPGLFALGFVICWILPGDMHILNLAVDPDARRQGLARMMLAAALEAFAASGGGVAALEVRPTNEGARELYAAYGFEQVGVRKKYYQRDNEDALILLRRVASADGGGFQQAEMGD